MFPVFGHLRRPGFAARPAAYVLTAWVVAAPASLAGQNAVSDFPQAYKRMVKALKNLHKFRLTLTDRRYIKASTSTVVNEIAYASDKRYWLRVRRTPALGAEPEEIIIRNGDIILVRRVRPRHDDKYCLYNLRKMPPRWRPHCNPLELLALPPIEPDDLKRFEAKGQQMLNGEVVLRYECPPRRIEKPSKDDQIPGLDAGPNDKTGKIVVVVGVRDNLPRRIEFYQADGRPAIIRTYERIDLHPRFSRALFKCRVPRGAYWIDGSAPPKQM